MPRRKTKTARKKIFSRKRGAFDRFMCHQIDSEGHSVLKQTPLDEREPKSRKEVLAEQKQTIKNLKREHEIHQWLREQDKVDIVNESQFTS
jgi:hypothetical protein